MSFVFINSYQAKKDIIFPFPILFCSPVTGLKFQSSDLSWINGFQGRFVKYLVYKAKSARICQLSKTSNQKWITGGMTRWLKQSSKEICLTWSQNGSESRSHMDQFGSHLNRIWINLDHRFTNSKVPILLNDSEKLNDISQIKMYKLKLSP